MKTIRRQYGHRRRYFDDEGTVTVFSAPDPEKGTYATKTTVGYGTSVVIPDGPAKGLTIGEELTRA
ncbi:hypothetical protein [Streptomyces sp. KS 21]|uniref:hypothetical protein n=1 Tax=Streptomyces sp. KS 21 TaxID=2485150 RepID=UPI0010639799|nr:hypothetical protein [Streptomyces sp. KS 21]TDU76422.1 hypothetical protein EDD91_3131 [Streptomyces sp. KS 21]